MRYQSGEEIRKGDKVLFHGENGEIKFVLETATGIVEMDRYLTDLGPGAMICAPKSFGRVYVRDTENAEDLVLRSRAD